MMVSVMSAQPDRRAALRARHRADILAAARSLITEHGAGGLTADDLAARADVARRTVFNHFASLEDVVVACLELELANAIDTIQDGVVSGSARSGPLEDLETSLRQADLPSAISSIARMLAGPPHAAAGERVRHEALRQTSEVMVDGLCERYPDTARLDVELLTALVMSGVGVVAAEWSTRYPQGPDAESRQEWARLLDVLFARVRRGFEDPEAPLHAPGRSSASAGGA